MRFQNTSDHQFLHSGDLEWKIFWFGGNVANENSYILTSTSLLAIKLGRVFL